MNNLLLLTGADIPFISGRISIHQPTIKEISLIGKKAFFIGHNFITTNPKEELSGDLGLNDMTNFEIIMSILNSKDGIEYKKNIVFLFSLLFPGYEVSFSKDKINLTKDNFTTYLNEDNFYEFQGIVKEMFSFEAEKGKNSGYNPQDGLAAKIAEKLSNANKKVAKQKGELSENTDDISIIEQYVLDISVGNHQSINSVVEYTVPQLKAVFEKFIKKNTFDTVERYKIAGATDLEEVDNWII